LKTKQIPLLNLN